MNYYEIPIGETENFKISFVIFVNIPVILARHKQTDELYIGRENLRKALAIKCPDPDFSVDDVLDWFNDWKLELGYCPADIPETALKEIEKNLGTITFGGMAQ
jgi:hypothetical protein